MSEIERININSATFKSILKHPYFDYEMTKTLVDKRREVGKFESLEEVMKINRTFDSLFNKIVPYLEI